MQTRCKRVASGQEAFSQHRYSNAIPIGSVVASPCRASALSAASRLSSYRSENGIRPTLRGGAVVRVTTRPASPPADSERMIGTSRSVRSSGAGSAFSSRSYPSGGAVRHHRWFETPHAWLVRPCVYPDFQYEGQVSTVALCHTARRKIRQSSRECRCKQLASSARG